MDYTKQISQGPESSPTGKGHRRRSEDIDSDTDFMEHDEESDDAAETADEVDGQDAVQELEGNAISQRGPRASLSQVSPVDTKGKLDTSMRSK